MSKELLRAIMSLAIDYFRWTQLVPMLACWAFLVLCLVAFALTSFESQGLAALEAVVAIVAGVASMLPEAITQRTADRSIDLSGDDLVDLALWSWFFLSMIAVAINWIVGERLRPRFLTTLRGRIAAAGIAAVLVSVAMIAIRLLAPGNFNGSFVSWLPFLLGAPVIVWFVSIYSLSVSAALGMLEPVLTNRPLSPRE
ncbi:MAG: hypothetical protein PVF63_06865 [Gammaproteobacteria bacterium]